MLLRRYSPLAERARQILREAADERKPHQDRAPAAPQTAMLLMASPEQIRDIQERRRQIREQDDAQRK
jgi:hypothetical protein